jgi:hypothetical protein
MDSQRDEKKCEDEDISFFHTGPFISGLTV